MTKLPYDLEQVLTYEPITAGTALNRLGLSMESFYSLSRELLRLCEEGTISGFYSNSINDYVYYVD